MKNTFLLASAAMIMLGGTAYSQETTPPGTPRATAPDTVPSGDAPATPPTTTGETPPAGSPDAATPPTGTTTPATPAAPTTPGTTPDAAATGGAPAPSAAAPADSAKMQAAQAAVEAGWAKYDPGNSGKLNALQFGTWIMAASGQDMSAQVEKTKAGKAANLPAVKVLNATSVEFSKADKDRDRSVSREELVAYLSA